MEAMRAMSERQGGAHVPQSDHHHKAAAAAAADEPAAEELQELLEDLADDSSAAQPAPSRPAPPADGPSPEEIIAKLRSATLSIVAVDPKAAAAVQPGSMSGLAC